MTGLLAPQPESIAKLIIIAALLMFLPLTAYTYYSFRRHRGRAEDLRVMNLLHLSSDCREIYGIERGQELGLSQKGRSYEWFYLSLAVAYVTLLSCIGLSLLFLPDEMNLIDLIEPDSDEVFQFPKPGSRIIFGMAFLGAYIWGMRYLFQRYSLNDLTPSAYYSLGVRMILSALIALVLFNLTDLLVLGESRGESVDQFFIRIWPAIAFGIGMFPNQGIRWFMEHIPLFSSQDHPSVRKTPIDMIEGVCGYDILRLEELGINNCYDLATADFVPLVLTTPYSARQLADWILQAKLCACFGDKVRELRENGIRTILDLEGLGEDEIIRLSTESSLNKMSLMSAQKAIVGDREIQKLRDVAYMLGRYTADEDGPPTSEQSVSNATQHER